MVLSELQLPKLAHGCLFVAVTGFWCNRACFERNANSLFMARSPFKKRHGEAIDFASLGSVIHHYQSADPGCNGAQQVWFARPPEWNHGVELQDSPRNVRVGFVQRFDEVDVLLVPSLGR